jgi:GNAT superfamily N-acetyltransferase
VAEGLTRDDRALIVAEDDKGHIVGTTQLLWAAPENQPHRADVAKMLVHRRARRAGVGAALLAAAERVALANGRTLLVLDTASGEAERLYERGGWQRVGRIPRYALLPDGPFCDTLVFYKDLASEK